MAKAKKKRNICTHEVMIKGKPFEPHALHVGFFKVICKDCGELVALERQDDSKAKIAQ